MKKHLYQLKTFNNAGLIDHEIIIADKPGLDETKKLGATIQELSYLGFDRRNEGLLVKIPDGRFGRTYDQLGRIKDKVPVFIEKNLEGFKFETTATLFDTKNILIKAVIS